MKHFKFILFLGSICLFCFGCVPTTLIQSSRQISSFNINQIDDLIGDTSKSVHGEQNVLYSVSNDKFNLYVTLMIADPKTQDKILHNGFTLWIDTTGNKKQSLGIAYPLPNKMNKETHSARKKGGEDQDQVSYQNRSIQLDMKRRMLLTLIDMDLIGYEGKAPQRVPAASNKEGISASLLIDSNGGLQYHAIIPFAKMHYHPQAHSGQKSMPLSLALTTNKEDSKAAGEKATPANRGTPMEGGGGMGGRGGGGHGGGGGGYSDPSNEPIDVWMHVKLAGY